MNRIKINNPESAIAPRDVLVTGHVKCAFSDSGQSEWISPTGTSTDKENIDSFIFQEQLYGEYSSASSTFPPPPCLDYWTGWCPRNEWTLHTVHDSFSHQTRSIPSYWPITLHIFKWLITTANSIQSMRDGELSPAAFFLKKSTKTEGPCVTH